MNINNNLTENTAEYDDSDIRETFFPYITKWKWFVISIIFSLTLGYFYTKFLTPLYKIETDLLIKDNKGKMGGQSDILKDLNMLSSDKIIDNEIQILKSKTILSKVIDALKLQTTYINIGSITDKEMYKNIPFSIDLLVPNSESYKKHIVVQMMNSDKIKIDNQSYSLNTPVQTQVGVIMAKATGEGSFKQILGVKFNSKNSILQHYGTSLKIEPVSKQATSLIITLEDAIPERGEDFLNKLVEEYNMAALEDKNKETSKTLTFINERLEGIASDLSSVEKNVEQYKSNNRITDISAQSEMFLQNVQGTDVQLNQVNIQLSILKNLEDYLHSNNSEPSTLPSMLAVEDPTLLGLVNQLAEVQLKKINLIETVPEANPLVANLTNDITLLKKAIEGSVKNLKSGLESTKKLLVTKNNQFQTVIKQVPTKERGLLDVMRQQDIKNNLFTYLLQKREETAMQLASGVADSRTIDAASSSDSPVKPIKNFIYLMFLIAGVFLPAAIIYFQRLLNFRVTRRLDIERVTRVPILAEISHSEDPGTLLVTNRPRSMIAEQIRALRTNLQFVVPNNSQKIILFTSNVSGEGKSFVSLNLGASLALSGKKCIILELDLRKPKLHLGLDMDNAIGLSNFLIGKVEINQIVKQIANQQDYYIITSGPIPPNPAELLVNGQIEVLLEHLKTEFDYIILDAPPVGLVTDAQILGGFADATMFIVRHNYTAKSHIRVIEELYRNHKFRNLSIIMNSIDMQNSYGYGYGDTYGYGGYYQEEAPNSRPSSLRRFFK